MKKIIFVAIALAGADATSLAQIKIPIAVTTAFNHKFPNVANVKWDKENAYQYEASFEFKGKKRSANFSNTGEWLETESAITFSQLFEKMQATYTSLCSNKIMKAVSKIETSANLSKFEVEILKGKKLVELFYHLNGTEIK